MKKVAKFSLYAFASVILLVFLLIAYLLIALPNVGKAEYIDIEITESKVERGRYLAYNVMMCADCHSERDFSKFSGPPYPGTEFVGGDVFDQSMGFPGRFVSSNITPFGIGYWTDGDLFRLITTGVKRDGEPIFPVMPYHNFGKLDREDIESVIAFLRTLPPVTTQHPPSKADFPFSLLMRTMPQKANLTSKPSKSNTVKYGEYIFNAAACAECHTQFDKGKFVGPVGGEIGRASCRERV